MQNSENIKPQNSFILLREELIKRFTAPIFQVSFWVFLITGILLFSACGIWIELGKYSLSTSNSLDGIQTAIFTFVPAIACPATMQIIYADNDKKYLRSVGYFVGVLLLLGAIGLLMFNEYLKPELSISMGVILSIISILTWWIANGLDVTFYDSVGQEATTGGGLEKKLLGNVDDYKVN